MLLLLCCNQLENVLLCLSEQHLKRKDDLGSKIDVEVCFFYTFYYLISQ
jgi:hypothetical protein